MKSRPAESTIIEWRFAGGTDPGRIRENNEDEFHCDAADGIMLVIDGMGGRLAGEVAAGIARRMILRRLERRTGTMPERIREAIALANNEILRQAGQNPEWEGMACVLTLALIKGRRLTVGHVGDSRLYEIRHGRIEKITRDHSPVGEREDIGQLTEIEAMRHPQRNEVNRSVGDVEHAPDDEKFIDIFERDLSPDTSLLMCSDGLSDMITSTQILDIVGSCAGLPDAGPEIVRRLIGAANDAGGRDNITVVYASPAVAGTGFDEDVKNTATTSRDSLRAGLFLMIFVICSVILVLWGESGIFF